MEKGEGERQSILPMTTTCKGPAPTVGFSIMEFIWLDKMAWLITGFTGGMATVVAITE